MLYFAVIKKDRAAFLLSRGGVFWAYFAEKEFWIFSWLITHKEIP